MTGISALGGFSMGMSYMPGMMGVSAAGKAEEDGKPILNPGESKEVQPGKRVSPAECQTCKERKYKDGSNEQVSFKAAAHISPSASAATVRGHEQEHVANAYSKAAQKNGKVLQASVSIKTAVCPECGRSYVAGGTTTTRIAFSKEQEKNPYMKELKAKVSDAAKGQNFDFAV